MHLVELRVKDLFCSFGMTVSNCILQVGIGLTMNVKQGKSSSALVRWA